MRMLKMMVVPLVIASVISGNLYMVTYFSQMGKLSSTLKYIKNSTTFDRLLQVAKGL